MIEYIIILGVLLTTTATLIGIMASQSMEWQAHWFVRTAIVLSALAPLLWIPAFELFVTLALEALVPDYLDGLPADPYASGGGVLRYARLDSEYLLYSVGPNQIDDGGFPRATEPHQAFDWDTAPDVSLSRLYPKPVDRRAVD